MLASRLPCRSPPAGELGWVVEGTKPATADARPSFWLADVSGATLLGVKLPRGASPALLLNDVSDFRMLATRGFKDISIDGRVSHARI